MARYNNRPPMGATYTPGVDNDYFMPAPPPNLVSPAPQRINPEMPGQIQDSLANLELNGNRMHPMSPVSPVSPYDRSPQHASLNQFPPRNQPQHRTYSPFPKLSNRTPNVPQSYEERETTLENARLHVLKSTDAEMQLAWSQDVLIHTEICSQHARRTSVFQDDRPTTPPVERQMKMDAINIVSFLADQQHPRADFIKGMWLEVGSFGYPQDKPESFRCFKRAASRGYSRANYRMGMQYESTGESIKALQHYKAGEALGDAAACFRMGMMSLHGQLGQAQDFVNATRLLRQAADGADENAPQGAYVFGMLLGREMPEIEIPEGILPIDLPSAKTNVEKAAYLGFAKAQLKMASAYELCVFGCDFNPMLSMHYNALAARQGEAEAEMAISKWYLCGHDGAFPKNEQLAYKYAQRAATCGGLPTAQFAMGYFYEIGLTVQSNASTAVEWYRKAAQNGNKDAQGRLNAISKSGTLSRKDHENMAVSKIKSQHGSRRGGPAPRPSGRANAAMPTIADEGAKYARPPQQRVPVGRPTPYPADDRPATSAPYSAGDAYARQSPRPGGPAGENAGFDQRPYPAANDARQQLQGRAGPMPSPRPNDMAGPTSGPPQGRAGIGPDGRPRPMPSPRPNDMAGTSNGPPPMGRQGANPDVRPGAMPPRSSSMAGPANGDPQGRLGPMPSPRPNNMAGPVNGDPQGRLGPMPSPRLNNMAGPVNGPLQGRPGPMPSPRLNDAAGPVAGPLQGRPGPLPSPRPNNMAGPVNAPPHGPQGLGLSNGPHMQGMNQDSLAPPGYGTPPRTPDFAKTNSAVDPIVAHRNQLAVPSDSAAENRNRLQAATPEPGTPRFDPPKPVSPEPSSQRPESPRRPSPDPSTQRLEPLRHPGTGEIIGPYRAAPQKLSKPPKASKNKSSKNSASQRPPGDVALTFEQMGVPKGKQDHDCAVM